VSIVADGDLHRIFAALEVAQVRYLVVGGVAVVLHGHPRFTADLDLVVGMDRDNILAAVGALAMLDYRPRAPVPAEALADPEARRTWVEDKGMTVFSLWSPTLPATEIDIFVEEPLPFEEAYVRGVSVDLGPVRLTVACLQDLLQLKRMAGRPLDLEDVAALEAIAREDADG
jgi:hypothetical protein